MKGKNHFTKQEAQVIERLIAQKLVADTNQQKSIRAKIRNLGFYASHFGLGGGYTVQDFRNAITIGGKAASQQSATEKQGVSLAKQSKISTKSQSDETYIIDLCDEVLQLTGSRQHRFDFLRGDTGVKLPVDAYYPNLNLVIEYYERQHSEKVSFFDKRITASGITRGEQRKKYDRLRQTELPKQGITLVVFDYSEFGHLPNKRLIRNRTEDLKIINRKFEALS